jgi:nucleotide-binding universal stress UspA family protein
MKEQDRPIVVLIERDASNETVMREARTRIVATAAPLVLVHVAPLAGDSPVRESRWRRPPEPWQRMLGLEATVSYDLRRMAEDWVGPATPVDVVVRFGDAVTELAAVAEARRAQLVVARSQPNRWLLGRGRDQQLRWAVNGPLLLVRTERGLRRIGGAHSVPVTSRSRP